MRLGFTRRFLAVSPPASRRLLACARTGPVAAPRDAQRLAGLIRHADSAALLGGSTWPAPQADAARLVTLIGAASSTALTPISAITDEALRAGLEEKIRTDFIAGDLVAVGGWLLSITEARLCALVSLERPVSGMPVRNAG
jgi:hypothetical protein